LTGVAFVALLAVSFAISGQSPDSGDSPDKVITFYKDHKNSQMASAALGGYAVVFILFFAGVLRSFLRTVAPGLAACAFGGAVLLGAGGAIFSSISFALADVPDKLNPAAAQALNLISNDFFWPFATGTAVFMIANGLAVARTGVLPRWLGWVAIVLGLAAASPAGFFSFLGVMLWVLVVAILLLIKFNHATPVTATAPAY
jgi:hypothetical protein